MASKTWSDDDLVALQIVRAKEMDALVDQNMLLTMDRHNSDLHKGFTFEFPEMVLNLSTGSRYPVEPPMFDANNLMLPRVIIAALRKELRQIILEDRKASILEQWHNRARCDSLEPIEFPMTAVHLVTATVSRLKAFRADPKYWRNSSGLRPSLVLSRAKADELDSGNRDSIFDILGKTAQNICGLVPSDFRVLHIAQHLLNQSPPQEHHKDRYSAKSKEAMVDYLLKPHLTFHGTQRHVVSSIVRNGFLLPGDLNPLNNSKHSIRCGNTYGRGIYSSPSAEFALSYSENNATVTDVSQYDGLKLIVCATIMGVSARMLREDNWRENDKPIEGATSPVGYSEMEYIVFHRAQILPCYVIHLDWGTDQADYFKQLPQNPWAWVAQKKRPHPKLTTEILSPGDKQRLKEAKAAKAAKYLGYGFGAASGANLVIEEIGEVSEDEEEYGEYQKDRVDATGGGEGKGFWDWEEEMEDGGFDGEEDATGNDYTEARQAKSLLNRIKYAEKLRKEEQGERKRRAEGLI